MRESGMNLEWITNNEKRIKNQIVFNICFRTSEFKKCILTEALRHKKGVRWISQRVEESISQVLNLNFSKFSPSILIFLGILEVDRTQFLPNTSGQPGKDMRKFTKFYEKMTTTFVIQYRPSVTFCSSPLSLHVFFISNPIFRVSPELLTKFWNFSPQVA